MRFGAAIFCCTAEIGEDFYVRPEDVRLSHQRLNTFTHTCDHDCKLHIQGGPILRILILHTWRARERELTGLWGLPVGRAPGGV